MAASTGTIIHSDESMLPENDRRAPSRVTVDSGLPLVAMVPMVQLLELSRAWSGREQPDRGPCTITVPDYPVWAIEREMTRFDSAEDLYQIVRFSTAHPVMYGPSVPPTAFGRTIVGHCIDVGESILLRDGNAYWTMSILPDMDSDDDPDADLPTDDVERSRMMTTRALDDLRCYATRIGKYERRQILSTVLRLRGIAQSLEERRWLLECESAMLIARNVDMHRQIDEIRFHAMELQRLCGTARIHGGAKSR